MVAPRLAFVLWLLFSVIFYFNLDIPHLSFTTLFVSHKLKKVKVKQLNCCQPNTWLLYLGESFSHAIEPNGTVMERYSVYSIRSDLKEIFFCSFFREFSMLLMLNTMHIVHCFAHYCFDYLIIILMSLKLCFITLLLFLDFLHFYHKSSN